MNTHQNLWNYVKEQLNPNPCAAPAFFSLDLCQIVQINRLPRSDSAPIAPSGWMSMDDRWWVGGRWYILDYCVSGQMMMRLCLDDIDVCNNLNGWELDTYRVGKGSPSLDSPIHTPWSSSCVHMGSTAWSQDDKFEYTRVVDGLYGYSTRVKYLHVAFTIIQPLTTSQRELCWSNALSYASVLTSVSPHC